MSDEPTPGREISIILPAYNEEDNILRALDSATKVGEGLFARHEIVVVDDGSRDRTAELVEERAAVDPRIRLVRHHRNGGYGRALRSGFQAAQMDLVFFTDADNQFDLEELELFLPWIDRVHVVAGYRIDRQDPWVRRFIAKTWNIIVRVLFYVPVRDIDCAFKLFRRSVFDELDLQGVGNIVNTELMVKLGRSGCGVVEVGVTHHPRIAGKARGFSFRIMCIALAELFLMYGKLQATAAPVGSLPRSEPPEPLSDT